MEEKLRIEEETRQAINRHGGDIVLVADETGRPLEYIIQIRKKMKADLMKNPEVSLQIAANVSTALLEGRKARTQNLWDMLESLKKREQILVCDICKSEVREVPGQSIETFYCPSCEKTVQRIIKDREEIYNLKLNILKTLCFEDEKMTDHLVKMKWTNQPDQPQSQTNVKQNVLVIGSDMERKVIEGYTNMRPMDRALFAEKLRKELLKLYEKAEREDTASDPGSTDAL